MLPLSATSVQGHPGKVFSSRKESVPSCSACPLSEACIVTETTRQPALSPGRLQVAEASHSTPLTRRSQHIQGTFLQLNMWDFVRIRVPRQLRYQPVTTFSEDEESGEQHTPVVLSRSPLREKSSGGLERGQKRRSQFHLAFSILCLFISLSFFLQAKRRHVSDARCLHRISAPSTFDTSFPPPLTD